LPSELIPPDENYNIPDVVHAKTPIKSNVSKDASKPLSYDTTKTTGKEKEDIISIGSDSTVPSRFSGSDGKAPAPTKGVAVMDSITTTLGH
jgi:hypothetical protein